MSRTPFRLDARERRARVNDKDPTSMKNRIVLPLLLALVGSVPVVGQQASFKPKEADELAKAIVDVRQYPEFTVNRKEQKNKEKADAKLEKILNKLEGSYEGMLLNSTTAWREVLGAVRVNSLPKRPPKGSLKELTRENLIRGKPYNFDYALYVPRDYDPKTRWPLIIALHDKGSEGKKYINEVWHNRAVRTEIQKKYIIVAPTIGEKTAGDRRDQVRFEWMDGVHLLGIVSCMMEVLSNYNVDVSRIYLDGTGVGGQTALEFQKMRPDLFAAAAARNALPISDKELNRDAAWGNLKSSGGAMIVSRKGDMLEDPANASRLEALQHYRDNEKVNIILKGDYEEINKSALAGARGSQTVDPVHDATLDIAAFFDSHKRDLTPTALKYVTYDSRSFRQSHWMVMTRANASPADKTLASIDLAVDRGSNTISVTCSNVESFKISLNDELVDLSKPVIVKVNGKEVKNEEVTRSFDHLLSANAANSHDPDRITVASMLIEVPMAEDVEDQK